MEEFNTAFEKYINNRLIIKFVSYPPYGDHTKPFEERFYGEGIMVFGGYKYISFGGGCSGEDCNTSYIVDPNDKLVAIKDW